MSDANVTYKVKHTFKYGDKTLQQGDTWQPVGERWDKKIVESDRLVTVIHNLPVAAKRREFCCAAEHLKVRVNLSAKTSTKT